MYFLRTWRIFLAFFLTSYHGSRHPIDENGDLWVRMYAERSLGPQPCASRPEELKKDNSETALRPCGPPGLNVLSQTSCPEHARLVLPRRQIHTCHKETIGKDALYESSLSDHAKFDRLQFVLACTGIQQAPWTCACSWPPKTRGISSKASRLTSLTARHERMRMRLSIEISPKLAAYCRHHGQLPGPQIMPES
ncbi:hypothetical protein DFH11DRAFT_222975 [Phellopilus nigrolimitatus]|nr:hypothetical protein DFH11DRAFT_222975 [Phellopilus nigrolimitatus]